ncbi:MAG TPA: Gfo/Idh/MocA family oxidoreductase, partial [Candidatus Glassbacteria bacterium]|nr:Gfo/Idh/MocA family oxidoreductase [Candidatus Glassbacteria bacterium]
SFFTEFERFDRHVEKLRRAAEENRVHYVSICSPNHLHDAHIRFALRVGAHAICEKPIVLNPWNCEALAEIETESGRRIYTILQLRLHPVIRELKARLDQEKPNGKHEVLLSYVTARGKWYHYSWKGIREKSGGLATNIGIHFFDLLIWLFGPVQASEVHYDSPLRTAGLLELEKARVRWFLSIDRNDLPAGPASNGRATYRSISIDGREVEFSEGFTDLHTVSYEKILAGEGFGISAAQPSIRLCHDIRTTAANGLSADSHPFLAESLRRNGR